MLCLELFQFFCDAIMLCLESVVVQFLSFALGVDFAKLCFELFLSLCGTAIQHLEGIVS